MTIDYDKYENATVLERAKALLALLKERGVRFTISENKDSRETFKPHFRGAKETTQRRHYGVTLKYGDVSHTFPYFGPVRISLTDYGWMNQAPQLKKEETVKTEETLPSFQNNDTLEPWRQWQLDVFVGFFYCMASESSYFESEGIEDLADYIASVGAQTAEDARKANRQYLDIIENGKAFRSIVGNVAAIDEICCGY